MTASVAEAAVVNPNGTKTLLANSVVHVPLMIKQLPSMIKQIRL